MNDYEATAIMVPIRTAGIATKSKVIGKKKLLLGGLLTKGIKSAYKAYRKAGGRKTSDIMKQPVKGAGKRSDAKDDVKYGIRLHGKGRYLSQREINKLMR